MATTTRRRLRFADFDELLGEVKLLEARGYERAGQWNLTQMAEHLTRAMSGSMQGFETRLAWPKRMVGRLVLPIVLKYGIRDGVRAPAAALPAAREADDPAVVEAFRRVVREFQLRDEELCPHPLFGRLTRGQWERFHLLHAGHHLGFLLPAEGSLAAANR